MPSLKRHDGEVLLDNRASGEIPPGMGVQGTHFSLPTLACRHCGGVWVLNPQRTRPRAYCRTCDKYICDGCAQVAESADYRHRTIEDLTEMVTSGRYTIAGGTVCAPILVPTEVK